MRLLLLVTMAALCLATEITGKWTGTLTINTDYGGQNPGPAMMVLQQEGSKLTGTAGADEGSQLPIHNGKVDNETLTFELEPPSGAVIKFVLKLDGEELKGDMEAQRGGLKQTAKLVLKRAK